MAIPHFRHVLEGQPYTICTDHKPLVAALTKPNDAWTARQQHHLSAIAETGCTMQYLPGLENTVADALSRVEISSIQLGIDYDTMATKQDRGPETIACKAAETNLRLEYMKIGSTKLLCDISTGRLRPLVPRSFRKQIFRAVHELAHPSIRSTTKLLTAKFVWHSIKKYAQT